MHSVWMTLTVVWFFNTWRHIKTNRDCLRSSSYLATLLAESQKERADREEPEMIGGVAYEHRLFFRLELFLKKMWFS